jgi:hypothetical protein
MKTLFWKPLSWLLYLVAILVKSVFDWIDRQQQIYETYQSDVEKDARHLIVSYFFIMKQVEMDLAYKAWLGKKEQKAGLK